MTGEELLEKIECADPLYIMEADQDSAFFAELGKMRRIDERRRRNRAIRFLSAAAVFMLCFMLYEIFGFIQIEKKGNTYPRDTKQTDMQGNLSQEQSRVSSNGEQKESSPSSEPSAQDETAGSAGNETAAESDREMDHTDRESRADKVNGEAGNSGLSEDDYAYPDMGSDEADGSPVPEGGNSPGSDQTDEEIQDGSTVDPVNANPADDGGSAQETISEHAAAHASGEGSYTISDRADGTVYRQVSPGEYSVYNAFTGEYEPMSVPDENDLGSYMGILTGEGEFSGSAVYAHNSYPDAGIIIVDSGSGLLICAGN